MNQILIQVGPILIGIFIGTYHLILRWQDKKRVAQPTNLEFAIQASTGEWMSCIDHGLILPPKDGLEETLVMTKSDLDFCLKIHRVYFNGLSTWRGDFFQHKEDADAHLILLTDEENKKKSSSYHPRTYLSEEIEVK